MRRQNLLGVLVTLLFAYPMMLPGSGSAEEWAEAMFTDAVAPDKSLLPEFTDAYGVAFRDINNDGFADLYVVRFRNLNRLFIYKSKSMTFKDKTIRSRLGGNLAPRGKENLELGASVIDFDNNGVQDVLIAGWGTTTHLFLQRDNLKFSKITKEAGINPSISGNAGIWSDIDLDGDLDLFISDEHHPNHLYKQVKQGRFEDVTSEYGLDDLNVSQGASFADVDDDGYPDLYVCNWFAPDLFYRNVNGNKFEAVDLPLRHLTENLRSNGVSFGDIDNDGDLDMLVTDRLRHSGLYRNDTSPGSHNWQFTDITEIWGLTNRYPAYSGLIADLNNDGWQDIFFANIGPNLLFVNSGSGSFNLGYIDEGARNSRIQYYSTGSAVADYDNDGDLDLFVSNKDTNSILYNNPLNSNSYVRFQLEGVHSNRDAIGAKVWLYEQDKDDSQGILVGYREVSGGSGYLSMSETVVHFGVHPERQYSARIRFPSSKEIVEADVMPGSTVYISELKGIPKTFIRSRQAVVTVVRNPVFWVNLFLVLFLVGIIWGFISLAIHRYQWTNRQITGFLLVTVIVLYVLFEAMRGNTIQNLLLTQVGFLILGMGLVTGFMEKLRQLRGVRYRYRKTLYDFSEKMIYIRDNTTLYEQLVNMIHQTMKPRFCNLMELNRGQLESRVSSGDPDVILPSIELSDEQKEDMVNHPSYDVELLEKSFPQLVEEGAHIVIPISRQDDLMALLVLGAFEQGESFHPEDLTLLSTLANQAALVIENNRFIEEAKTLTRKVTESETREKYVKELEDKNATLEQLYAELKETQAQLIQSEKMSSLGQLVAGVAHQLNNPISYVYANMKELQKYIAVLERREEKDAEAAFVQEDIDRLIAESVEGSNRVKTIVEDLRNFSRLGEAEFKEADIHEGLESTLVLLGGEFGDTIKIHKNYGTLPRIYCMPGHLNQVFMNLLLNAIHAVSTEGNIWIATREAGNHVYIEFRDDGAGIPKENLDKLFDPFFTTKESESGIGLGLSISFGIVAKHGGTISVESTKGEGSTFTIKLPKHPGN